VVCIYIYIYIYIYITICLVARIWSPYKELQYTVESTIQKKQSDAVQDLESSLRKHKADFISLLQNPVNWYLLCIDSAVCVCV